MSARGSTHNLGQGSQEGKSFRALINSIAPGTAEEGNGKFSREAVEKLSEKLNDLVGDEAIKDYEHRRNERGELVNEDGLPIIDISEPLPHSEEDDSQQPQQQSNIQDVPLIRLSSLPSVAKEKLRQQRDRILDALEEEERQEEERQKRVDMEEREEILRKRREEAVNEKAKLQKAKELQKKMGKALMRNMGFPEEEDPDSSAKEGTSGNAEEKSPVTAVKGERKKTVTFNVEADDAADAGKPEWGDVTAARLRSGQRPTLLQSFRPDANPVKLNVIERKPAGQASATTTPNHSIRFSSSAKDSDDESEAEDNNQNPPSDNDQSDDEVQEEDLPDSEEEDGGEVELENEYDLDYAQHQREIALEYYNKRNTIGQDAAKAMMDHSHEEELENDSTLEAPVPNNQSKPSLSRFKANRIATAYGASTGSNKPSTSIGASVLPESSARTIQHALRSGRIDDDNRLVGGEHDSDSELEAEGLQEVLELLKKGEVYNLGPDGQYLYTSPQSQPNTQPDASTATSTTATANASKSAATPADAGVAEQQGPQQRSLPPLNRPKVSRFKADLSQSGRPSTTSRSETSTPPTPITQTARSSPKLPSAVADAVVEKKKTLPHAAVPDTRTRPSQASPSPTPSSSSPMIVDSPSFRALSQANSGSPAFTSMIVESPSLPRRANANPPTSLNPTPTFPSMIVDSPSFPAPGQRSRRPERPPTVVSSEPLGFERPTNSAVTERSVPTGSSSEESRTNSSPIAMTVLERAPPRGDNSGSGSTPGPGKVSRFRQSRGQ
ncbi:hypothetical protein NP233_g104 [Leucocoprinus birnbaumii]|uniref:DUF3835 domain-containing protein n=1 Tax=Leucocoprinus birnbaumii TaxID=56174 RepID=A0AAD5YYU4_9AGAR|nr:hypothetical protein NP233_g104 [Leucocoprinus birnbaumii]